MVCKYCASVEELVIDCIDRSYKMNVNAPNINVLMTVYNNDKFLEKALRSVREVATKICVVEGGWNPKMAAKSDDKTIDILSSLFKENVIDYLFHIYDTPWYNDPKKYIYQCDKHRQWMENAISHPFYDGRSLQNQLMARDMALQAMLSAYDSAEKAGWLFIVDSDEIYEKGSLDNLIDYLCIMGEDYDFFNIEGMNFYFNYEWYTTEWYRRLFKMRQGCFFSDDNSLETEDYVYKKFMNIPSEMVTFFHYNYIKERQIDKKLLMWREEDVRRWYEKHQDLLAGKEYDGRGVHLFEHKNPGYSNYILKKFNDKHPKGIHES